MLSVRDMLPPCHMEVKILLAQVMSHALPFGFILGGDEDQVVEHILYV